MKLKSRRAVLDIENCYAYGKGQISPVFLAIRHLIANEISNYSNGLHCWLKSDHFFQFPITHKQTRPCTCTHTRRCSCGGSHSWGPQASLASLLHCKNKSRSQEFQHFKKPTNSGLVQISIQALSNIFMI